MNDSEKRALARATAAISRLEAANNILRHAMRAAAESILDFSDECCRLDPDLRLRRDRAYEDLVGRLTTTPR